MTEHPSSDLETADAIGGPPSNTRGRTARLTARSLTIPRVETTVAAPAAGPPDSKTMRPSRRASAVASPTADRTDMPGALAAVLLCFAGLSLFGSDRAELALIMDALWGVVILVALWRRPVRFNLFQVRTLHLISGLFIALIAWVVLTLTPLAPQPPGGVWLWVGGSAGTIDKAMTLVELTKLIGLAAAFSSGLLLADTDRRAELTLRALCAGSALFAVFALLQHVITPTRVLGTAKLMFADRLTGTFLSANIAAGFFGGVALLNLATLDAGPQVHASRVEGDVRFILRYGALILIFACLVLTASRMGALAVIAGLAVSFGLSLYKERDAAMSLRSQSTARLVVFGVFLLLAVAGQLLISRFGETDRGLSGRSVLFSEHLRAFLASPLTGYGLGSFSAINDQLVTPDNFYSMWNIRAAHNVYLQWLEEAGLVGALLMFSVIGLIHWEIFRGLRSRQSMGWLIRGVLGCSTVLLVQGFGDFTLQTPAIALTSAWATASPLAAAGRWPGSRRRHRRGSNGRPSGYRSVWPSQQRSAPCWCYGARAARRRRTDFPWPCGRPMSRRPSTALRPRGPPVD